MKTLKVRGIFLLLLIVLLAAGCGGFSQAPAPTPTPIPLRERFLSLYHLLLYTDFADNTEKSIFLNSFSVSSQ
jgi:hypothetical protein